MNKMDTVKLPGQKAEIRYGVLTLEKRKYPRFSVDLPVEYHRIDSSIITAGRATDVSEGGLLIYFPERMEIGQRLNLKLFLSMGSKLNTIEMDSEVAWVEVRIAEDSEEYRTAVKFVEIFPDDMTKLKEFLTSLSLPQYTR